MRKFFSGIIALLFIAGAFSASHAIAAPMQGMAMKSKMAKNSTLYDRLGGKKAIVAVVDAFVGRVAGDKRINKFFAKTAADPKRLAKFKGNLVDQICAATGGPCKYKGKSMKAAHAGMGIGTADFGALVGDLSMTLDQFHVAKADKDALLGALAPMQKDIVEKK